MFLHKIFYSVNTALESVCLKNKISFLGTALSSYNCGGHYQI